MSDTPLVFNHTLQGLFSRTFPRGVPPTLKTQLRAAGIGRAMFGTLKLLGPRRMLQRARKNFRSGNNYTEVEFTDVSPTEMDVWTDARGVTLRASWKEKA